MTVRAAKPGLSGADRSSRISKFVGRQQDAAIVVGRSREFAARRFCNLPKATAQCKYLPGSARLFARHFRTHRGDWGLLRTRILATSKFIVGAIDKIWKVENASVRKSA
jgi:hypothetical protein